MKIFINYFSKLILIAIPFIFHLSCLNLTRPFTKEIKEKYKFAKSGGIYYQERMLIGRDIKKVSIEKSQKGWRYKLHIIEESNSYKKPYDLCLNLDQKDIDTHTIDLEQQKNIVHTSMEKSLPTTTYKTNENGNEIEKNNLILKNYNDLGYCDRGDWKLFTVLNSTEIEGKINFPAEILYAEVSKGKGRFNSLIGKEIQIEEIESKKNELLVDYYLGYDYTDLHRKREIQKKRYITDPKEIKKILKGNSFEDKYYKNSKLDFYFGFSEKLPSYTTKYPEGVPINKLFYKINDFSYSQENIPPFVFIERIDGEYYSSGNLYTQAIFYTAIYPGAIAIDLATTPLFFVYCSPFVFSLLQLEWIVINLFLRYVRLDFSYKKIIYKNLILKCSLQT